jgi:phage-related baseplate assembly protein
MAFTLDELTTPLTRQQVEAKIYEVIATLGTTTTTWKPGAVARTMIVACSIVIAAFSQLTALIARSGFLELASGAWLALVAWYVFGVEKEYGTYAEGSITLTNTGGGIYTFDVDDLTVSNPASGKTYRNTSAFSLSALSTVTVAIRAVEAGSNSTSGPGTITAMETTIPGVTCMNAAAVIGLDEEADPTLRARCGEKLGSLSPMGPWDAYSYAARNARRSDLTRIGVTRVRSVKDGFGNLTVYVATASGTVTGAPNDITTDLGAVNEAIQRLAAPLAVTANVASATPLAIPVTYRVWMYNTSGLTQAEIVAAIAAKLVAFMAGQPMGGNILGVTGKIYRDAIATAIGAALPQIFHVIVDTPSGDTTLSISQVPVLGTVTPTAITQIPPSEGAMS